MSWFAVPTQGQAGPVLLLGFGCGSRTKPFGFGHLLKDEASAGDTGCLPTSDLGRLDSPPAPSDGAPLCGRPAELAANSMKCGELTTSAVSVSSASPENTCDDETPNTAAPIQILDP